MLDQAAPDFSLPATGGQTLSLAQFRGRSVVLYFYPKDSTPGCTTESQQFRDLHPEFLAAGSIVLGISRDSLKSHDNFRAKQALPFDLVSDPDETACTLFGVMKMKNMYGKQVRGVVRSTFLIGPDGTLRQAWRLMRDPNRARSSLHH